MPDETSNQPHAKQEGDEANTDTEREGYSADELGAASIYDDPTQIAQQMRRGDESQGDPDARDVVGTTDFSDLEEGRTDRDTTSHADTTGDPLAEQNAKR